jgi:hypothetical protein
MWEAAKQLVAHLELELWEEPRDSFSKFGLQMLLQGPPRQALVWALALERLYKGCVSDPRWIEVEFSWIG